MNETGRPDPANSDNAAEVMHISPRDNAPGVSEAGSCGYCGRPITQPSGWGWQAFCTDNGGACERAAAAQRSRQRNAPGLTGQVALVWDMVEQLQHASENLAVSLTSGLSVAGVEQALAQQRAESATEVAVAHADRDAARQECAQAWSQAAEATRRAEAQEHENELLSETNEQLRAEHAHAVEQREEALRTAQEASSRAAQALSERDHLIQQVQTLGAAMEEARAEVTTTRARIGDLQTSLQVARSEATAAERDSEQTHQHLAASQEENRVHLAALEEARSTTITADSVAKQREAEAAQLQQQNAQLRGELNQALIDAEDAATAEDAAQRRLQEEQVRSESLQRTLAEKHSVLAALNTELEAARAEAERARKQIDQITRQAMVVEA